MKVLLTGATGMVGGLVLQHCLNQEEIDCVVSLVRRSSGVQHPKLNEVIINDFLKLDEAAGNLEEIYVVYYCLGAYTGAVDRETLRKVTVDYPEALAKAIKHSSPNAKFCLLSGAGADRSGKSRMAFAKDKGEIENRLLELDFQGFHSFRPGYIYPVTPRQEPGFGYRLMRWLYPIIRLFGDGSSVTSTDLAKAMFRIGIEGSSQEIFENREIVDLARKS